jgi:hypothetical protein
VNEYWRLSLTFVVALAVALDVMSRPSSAQEQAQPRAARSPLPPEQIKTLVDQLGADEFLARETAMLELVAVGGPAIPAVATSVRGSSLEATSRALYVLQQIGLSPDPDTQEAARAALAQAATQRENTTVARRAAGTLAQLLELRAAQALTELEGLGAKVSRSQSFNGVAVEEIVESIEIGASFRGEAADLARLKWLTAIKLILSGDKIRDEWLKSAAAMTEVEELHLYQAAVSDAGLAAFAEHPNIRELGIYYTPVTGAALAHMQKLPRLSFVKLYGTKIERADATKFQEAQALPADKLDHRKGAFLGVGCMTIDNACVLSTVHAGSPAEKAGLERDDVLIRFGDARVADFAALTAQISQLDSGDVAEIEVQREVEDEEGRLRTKRVVVRATLAPWDLELAVENGQRP